MKRALYIVGFGAVLVYMGYWFGYYKSPTKVIEKVKIEKQIVTVEASSVNRNIKTTTTKKTDGTVITVTEDKSIEKKDAVIKETSKEYKVRVETTELPKWHMSGMMGLNLENRNGGFKYGLSIDRRIIGPIWLGGVYIQDPMFLGLRLSISF